MKPLEDYLFPTQTQLFSQLSSMYKGKSKTLKGSYILVRGEAPIMLLAHLDTVHKEPVKTICKSKGGSILMSPQGIGGDDRCGVYALNTIYERATVKPWLLFTCDEEIGGVGARKFCESHRKGKLPKELDSLKVLIEIDRKGKNEAVYYDCDNEELEKYITRKGFVTDWGSFTDISSIAPELGVAAVNLSSGYYNAHTLHEYIDRKHLNGTINKVLSIVEEAAKPDFPMYEYIEATYMRSRVGGWGYYDWDDLKVKTVPVADDPDLSNIPVSIRKEYEALLDFYSVDELEEIRAQMGDNMIEHLFESEFGGTFDDVFGVKEDEDDGLCAVPDVGGGVTLTTKDYYDLLAKKHEQTDWSNLESIRAYNEYARILRKERDEENEVRHDQRSCASVGRRI